MLKNSFAAGGVLATYILTVASLANAGAQSYASDGTSGSSSAPAPDTVVRPASTVPADEFSTLAGSTAPTDATLASPAVDPRWANLSPWSSRRIRPGGSYISPPASPGGVLASPAELELFELAVQFIVKDDGPSLNDFLDQHKEFRIDTQNDRGRTLLHEAAVGGKLKSAEVLMSRNAPSCKDGEGMTPSALARGALNGPKDEVFIRNLHSILGALRVKRTLGDGADLAMAMRRPLEVQTLDH